MNKKEVPIISINQNKSDILNKDYKDNLLYKALVDEVKWFMNDISEDTEYNLSSKDIDDIVDDIINNEEEIWILLNQIIYDKCNEKINRK